MKIETFIDKKVHDYYWEDDLNCATTMLKILEKIFEIKLESQITDAAVGMHGAGKFGSQCGLVEGSLMFFGIYGYEKNISKDNIIDLCYDFAGNFNEEFGSLLCRELRPEGFKKDNPPHLCEDFTKSAVRYTVDYIEANM